jgi:hypothetical protein
MRLRVGQARGWQAEALPEVQVSLLAYSQGCATDGSPSGKKEGKEMKLRASPFLRHSRFMLKSLLIFTAMAFTGMAQVPAQKPPVHVDGYTTKEGTTVAPHDRTAPDKTRDDNWSTKGNTNPETGKPGDKPPVKPVK